MGFFGVLFKKSFLPWNNEDTLPYFLYKCLWMEWYRIVIFFNQLLQHHLVNSWSLLHWYIILFLSYITFHMCRGPFFLSSVPWIYLSTLVPITHQILELCSSGFSTRGDFTSQGTFGKSGDIFVCHNGGWGWYWHLTVENGNAGKHPTMHKPVPHKELSCLTRQRHWGWRTSFHRRFVSDRKCIISLKPHNNSMW